MTDEICVIVPAWNAAGTIAAQVGALLRQLGPADELVVVDNRSTDGTQDLARQAGGGDARVRIIEATARVGPAHARNTGVAASTAPLLAFCDADDVVAPGWLERVRSSLGDSVFVAGWLEVEELNDPLVVSIRGRPPRSVPTFFDRLAFAHGSNLGIRRSAWEAVGGMDEDPRFLVGEDIDLAIRLLERGVRPVFDAAAVVHYRYRTGARELFRQARSQNRVVPLLVARLQQMGLGRPNHVLDPAKWLWLVARIPVLRTPEGRARWAYQAGVRVGLVEGSIIHRTVTV